jgi:hypothetical protein
MQRIMGFVVLALAAAFIIFATVGLFNSNLNSREVLLIVLCVAGVALFPIGHANVRGQGTSERR